MKTYRIATIPGDGIGKEVVPAGQQVLEALAPWLAFRLEGEQPTEKFGVAAGLTVSETDEVRVVAPETPLTVTLDVPVVAVVVAEKVRVALAEPFAGGVTDVGAKAHETPEGSVPQLKLTAELNPPVDVTVQVVLALLPWVTDTLDGLHATEKSGVAVGRVFIDEASQNRDGLRITRSLRRGPVPFACASRPVGTGDSLVAAQPQQRAGEGERAVRRHLLLGDGQVVVRVRHRQPGRGARRGRGPAGRRPGGARSAHRSDARFASACAGSGSTQRPGL